MEITQLTQLEPLKSIMTSSADKTTDSSSADSFEEQLISAISNVKELENQSAQASYDLAMGNSDDITTAMLTATKAQTAIQVTTQITTRAVNAYREIMQMSI